MRVLVPDPGDRLVPHTGHAAVEEGGLAEDRRHVPALGPDELRPRALQLTGMTRSPSEHDVSVGSGEMILIDKPELVQESESSYSKLNPTNCGCPKD